MHAWHTGKATKAQIKSRVRAMIKTVPLESLFRKQERYTTADVKTVVRKLMPKKTPARVRDSLDTYLRQIHDATSSDFIRKNTRLITNMSDDLLNRIADVLEKNEGSRWEEIAPKIQAVADISVRRARLIARDQTITLQSQITQQQHQDLGITEYVWTVTSDPSRTREWHADLDGEVIQYDDPPMGGGTAKTDRGHAGSGINCMCQQIPVVPLFAGLDI